jgi:DNA polymerase I-like protein with 3'-5' exonuclease and polymerase domains
MRLVFDIESNHYDLGIIHTIHCLVAQDIDTEEVYSFVDNIEEGVELLSQADELIGHNIIRFDIPAIKKFYPQFNPSATLSDTLIMSRLGKPKWYNHTLETWGKALRFKKGDYAEVFREEAGDSYTEGQEWQTFSQAMLDYCVTDVRVNRRVYLELSKCMPRMFTRDVLDLEQYTTELMEKQKEVGVGFDKEKATKLMLHLMDRREELDAQLRESFGGFYKPGKLFTPKRDNKRLGYRAGSPMSKIVWTDFSPTSRDHIAYWLQKKYNWVPTEYTDGGKPKISETVLKELADIYPEASPLAEHFMVSKRLSAISEGKGSWFNNLSAEGRIHGSVNPQGTVTHRATHSKPNLGQVPKVGIPYGAECRELFSHGMGPDWTFMGCDMSGIEFRLLAHYLYQFDNGALVDTVLNGDIHSVNQKAAGLPTRDLAKTFIYAFIYGGGDGKLGSIVGGTIADGARLRAKFLKGMPALGTLLQRVNNYRAENKNYLRLLDGRHIPVEASHVTLNYLLQSAGAILSKAWMRRFHQLAEEAGLGWGKDYMQLLWVHDEVQCAVRRDKADLLGALCVQAIEEVGKQYGLKCPITGEYDLGESWRDTH